MAEKLDIFEVQEVAKSIFEHFVKPEHLEIITKHNGADITYLDQTFDDQSWTRGQLLLQISHPSFNLNILQYGGDEYAVWAEKYEDGALDEWLAVWRMSN